MLARLIILMMLLQRRCLSENYIKTSAYEYNKLDEHTLITESEEFPFVVAILKMSKYLSAGALINDNWVLTAADALYTLRDLPRIIRVRLGSINYKKGGILQPVQFFEIHPYFDDTSPIYDVALIKLTHAVRFTPSLKSIRLQKKKTDIGASHFIVTAWIPAAPSSDKSPRLRSMDEIKRTRLLSISHLHPSFTEECTEEIESLGINDTETLFCLDSASMTDPCWSNTGAPVVLNNVLWGIISSWRPNNCENDLAGPIFANLVSAPDIADWINAISKGYSWPLPHISSSSKYKEQNRTNDFL